MVLPVRTAFALRRGRVDVNDDQATDDATLGALGGSCCHLVSYMSLLFRRWYLMRLKGPRFDRSRARSALPPHPKLPLARSQPTAFGQTHAGKVENSNHLADRVYHGKTISGPLGGRAFSAAYSSQAK